MEWRVTAVTLVFAPLIVAANYFEQKTLAKEGSKRIQSLEKSTKVRTTDLHSKTLHLVFVTYLKDFHLKYYFTLR